MIGSITNDCNLDCTGCYARKNARTMKGKLLSDEEWGRIFDDASRLGVSMFLLAGGEPLLRRSVIEAAAGHRDILFPVFTNGTLFDDAALRFFDKNRNMVPMLSLEGDDKTTDTRRGAGVYENLMTVMPRLAEAGLLYGASVTVTARNLELVTSDEFSENLRASGCRVLLFVEYVPITGPELALDATGRSKLTAKTLELRKKFDGRLLYVSFPGDEAESGGCLAAARGFFHINPAGGCEPCPFSPFSDTNLHERTLEEALGSPLFRKIRTSDALNGERKGGCVLFEHAGEVEELLAA
jgi:MoaA/NifB/PqqE/SkfB family radical SAM enzyme